MTLSRRRFLQQSVRTAATLSGLPLLLSSPSACFGREKRTWKPKPVILATDIGDDIDDTWALGFLLKCPELDLKLAVTEYGKPQYRAKLLAKFLQVTGHGHVPVGLGSEQGPKGEGGQAAWVRDYDLATYPGKVHADGVQAMIELILHSREPVTLIAIGPMPTVAAALRREPRIAKHLRFVGMDGSVRVGYDGAAQPSAEWNVKADVPAAQAAFAADWPMTITPLDTCGLVKLEGEEYRAVAQSSDKVAATVMENYRLWSAGGQDSRAAESHSSVLFDTVAVYLAFAQAFCPLESLALRVDAEGFTRVDPQGKRMEVATQWKDLDGYRRFLVERLTV